MREVRSFLAYVRPSRPTGRALARMLGVTEAGMKAPRFSPDVLIRWGSQRPMPEAEFELNKPPSLALASDKPRALETLRQAGVSTVPIYRTFTEASMSRRALVFGRDRRGMRGKDIVIYDPHRILKGKFPEKPEREHDWYTTFIESRREVRIHVCNGKVIRVQGKYCDEPTEMSSFIKNYANGYRFRTPKNQLRPQKRNAAVAAVKALGLDFGAVDMIITDSSRAVMEGYAILEVNTAPAGSPLTVRCYAAELACYVNQLSGGDVHLAGELLQTEVGAEDVED